jgi:hypothetical protein
MDQNRHDLTHAQASFTLPLNFTCTQQLFPEDTISLDEFVNSDG